MISFPNWLKNLFFGVIASIIVMPLSYWYASYKRQEENAFHIDEVVSTVQDQIINYPLDDSLRIITDKQITLLIESENIKYNTELPITSIDVLKLVYYNVNTSPLLNRSVKKEYLTIVFNSLDAIEIYENTTETVPYPNNKSDLNKYVAVITSIIAILFSFIYSFGVIFRNRLRIRSKKLMLLNKDEKYKMAERYFLDGLTDKAIDECLDQLCLTPKDPKTLTLLATLYRTKGEYDKALDVYSEILSFQPENKIILNKVGIIHSQYKEEYDKALEYYKKAEVIDENYLTPQYNIACTYARQNKIDEVIKKLDNLIECDQKYLYLIKSDEAFSTISKESKFIEFLNKKERIYEI